MVSPRDFDEEVLLDPALSVRVRAIRPTDRAALASAFGRLSPETVYSRFLRFRKDLTPGELTSLTDVDFESHVALVAVVGAGGEERIVGSGRYLVVESSGAPRTAELALTVADEYQGRGIGSALLERLAVVAISRGIARFEAVVRRGNEPVLHLLEESGFRVDRHTDLGTVRVFLRLDEPTRGSSA